ncbi:unnamed protein product [Arctia plantaginis]|uniref:BTB domain-containing protein n=1 Tax=Arctia plantaginis TaxID=874455 RepID=A0A8S0ZEE1_ARCPL|nr:unnamed protein product [Arctia plantaginis]CAB3248233.1 unnamed protein product [Arctia plantaginis]
MANQEISLKWNGYQNNILFNVKELFKDEGLSDVTLVSEGHCFKAHKVILSANSPVFRTIFQQNPHKDPIIVLHDISTAALKTLMTFMYNGEVNVTEEFLPVLLKTAETLRICGLSTSSEVSRDDDKTSTSLPKKRKKGEHEDGTVRCKKCVLVQGRLDVTHNSAIPKYESIESPLTDYSGDNTNDGDIAVLEDQTTKKINKGAAATQSKKRKNAEHNNNNKCKKCTTPIETDVVHKICSDNGKQSNIILKIEPVESPLTDYSGDNTNDTDIALLEDSSEKKHNINPENCSNKCLNERIDKIEVSSTQPCLNEKINANNADTIIEIDKEVETVLQSGTRIESLSIKTESLNSVSSEAQNCKDPSFPCPFCPRVYNSWGYRRRHVKSRHVTNRLSCKWCVSVLSSTGAWYSHATRAHGVPHEEARNSLVVMVEAHAVLTLNEPNVTQLLV